MDEALKLCPFCGNNAYVSHKSREIVCGVCGATMSKDGCNYEEIIRMWNKRVEEQKNEGN